MAAENGHTEVVKLFLEDSRAMLWKLRNFEILDILILVSSKHISQTMIQKLLHRYIFLSGIEGNETAWYKLYSRLKKQPLRSYPPSNTEMGAIGKHLSNLCLEGIELKQYLGHGAFGDVWQGVKKGPEGEEVPVAVKFLQVGQISSCLTL